MCCRKCESYGRLMINQMPLTSRLMWFKGAIQLFDVPLLLSQQLQKFKAAVLRSCRTKIS